MANTLTNLIPVIYEAVDVVSRELVGFIPSVMLNATADQAAVGQTIRYPITGAMSATDITPAATGPAPSAQTVASDTMAITKSRSVSFFWEAEETKGLSTLYKQILKDQFAQAMRTLVNEIESDIAALYINASRAYGTAGTTPFGTDLEEIAQLRKILADNGAPLGELKLIIDTTAGAKLRKLGQLTKANEAGSTDPLRRGVLLDIFGFEIRESAQIKTHTKGTGSGYLVNAASGLPVGTTEIPVDTGTGTILAGDVVTFGSDTTQYVVTEALSSGVFKISPPGLLKAVADNTAVNIVNNHVCNMAFAKSAIHLLCRVPAMPEGGDAADDVTVVTDPVSGLSFQVAMYRQYRRVAYEVGIAWGVKATKKQHIALLLG